MNFKLKKFIKNPGKVFYSLGYRGYFKWLSDEKYLKLIYKMEMGKKLNIDNPKTYNEKIQYLKLREENDYTNHVDKLKVREIVRKVIGEKHLIPLIGVYDSASDIDFSNLPKQFVIKCTHDSGGVVVCDDLEKLNIKKTVNFLNKRLKRNYFWAGREKPYLNIKPQIIIEKFMLDKKTGELPDYKFFCFDGQPLFSFIATERNTGKTKFDFFDEKFEKINVKQYYENSFNSIEKPEKYDEMIKLAKKLSRTIKHVRVDFYVINNEIYFGELTFYHFSGFREFNPESFDTNFGEHIDLVRNS